MLNMRRGVYNPLFVSLNMGRGVYNPMFFSLNMRRAVYNPLFFSLNMRRGVYNPQVRSWISDDESLSLVRRPVGGSQSSFGRSVVGSEPRHSVRYS